MPIQCMFNTWDSEWEMGKVRDVGKHYVKVLDKFLDFPKVHAEW